MARGATDHRALFGACARARTLLVAAARLLVGVLALASTEPARAADRERLDDPFEITADRIDYDGRLSLYVATGRVRVLQADRRLEADWVAFSTETRIGVAEGGVQVVDRSDTVHAEFMVFDVDSLRGMFFEGGLDAGSEGFKLRAKEMIRTGENTFRMTDGVFTTCRCPEEGEPPWTISTEEADVEVGSYGTVRNATFDILGLPVLWVPWAFFPVKSDRETGLLLPQIEFGGRSGAGGGIPFFWAAHPQLNVILTPFYYSERGFKGDAELEYVFGERSEGELFVSGLRDQRDEDSGATRDERWGVKWDHDQELPAEWRWQTDANVTSDNFYSDDFSEFRQYAQSRFMESTTNVNRAFGRSGGFGLMFGGRYADDVQGLEIRGVDFVDTDDVLLQRFGEAQADVQPGMLTGPGGLEARFETDVIYFSSLRDPEDVYGPQGGVEDFSDGRFWDVGVDASLGVPIGVPPITFGENDGIFQPGEVIGERGIRAVLHPRLARPFEIADVIEVVPEVGWRQSLYWADESRFSERGLVTARVDARTRLARDYAWGRDDRGRLRHVLEPRVGWGFVNQRQQDRNPLFVPAGTVEQARLRSLSMENLTRNPSDRVESVNRVVLGLGQRFYTAGRARQGLGLRADVQTAIDWDFAEGGLGAAYLDARLMEVGPLSARLMAAFDPGTVQLDEGGFEVSGRQRIRGSFVRDMRVATGYRYRRRLPTFLESNRGRARLNETDSVSQLNLLGEVQLSIRVRLRYRTIFKFAGEDEFIRNEGTVEYVSKCRCWAIAASVASDRRDQISGGLSVRFMGLGQRKDSPFNTGFGTGVGF